MHFSPTAGQGEAGIWKVEDTWCYLSKSFCVKLELGFPGGSEVKSSTCNAGDLSSIPGKIPWRRKWQPTPVLLPGESHGWRSLASYSPRGHKELDTTEQLHFHFLLLSRRTMFNNLLPCLYDEDDTLIAQLVKNLPAMQETLV